MEHTDLRRRVAEVPIDLVPTTPRRHITGSLALNIPYVHRHSSGDWHPTVWFDTTPRRLAPHHVTDEAVYGRLLDLLGNSGLRDARRGLATLRHPGGEAPEKVWAATHERAVIELAWDQLQSTVGTGLAPGWPPIDNDDYFRLMRYPDQWVRIRWWSWHVCGILTEEELAIWEEWRRDWWPWETGTGGIHDRW